MTYSKILCATALLASTVTAFGQAAPAPAPAGGAKPYTVVDGYKVDPNTLQGFRTWRSAACDRCHGANQEGLVGPSLINSLKTLSKDEFVKTVSNGRPNTQMVAFSGNAEVMKNMDQLYAYLKGRSDGAITKARVEAMP
jgi:mono/diheme cytochrome c family protein